MFINAFSQAKNLIDKQIKIGKRIKEKQVEKKCNRDKVSLMRKERIDGKTKEK